MLRVCCGFLVASALLLGTGERASAQALIFSLPAEDGTWLRLEGTYKNTQSRPDAAEGDLELTWRSELTIKSVGKKNAKVGSRMTACRWLEFKAVQGKESAEGIQPGPFGTRIYKVLVPEDRVIGKNVDRDGIPVTFLPIVKGYRKIADREVTPVTETVLAVYPMISLVSYYTDFHADPKQPEELQLPQGAVQATRFIGSRKLENETSRSLNEGMLWRSDSVPFGLAKLQVKVTRDEKDSTAGADAFKRAAVIDVEMSAVANGNDAKSELPDSE